MTEKTTIKIGSNAEVKIWRDNKWTILSADDGNGSVATVSLTLEQALDVTSLLRGHAISVASLALTRVLGSRHFPAAATASCAT
jgi:hypothetical protein